MTRTRCIILAFHAVFLMIALGSCQYGEEPVAIDAMDSNDYDDEFDVVEDENDESIDNSPRDYVDDRIDETPTFVTPVEKFIKTITGPFRWLGGSSSLANSGESENGVGRFIEGIAKPIRQIVTPYDKNPRNFGEVLNLIADRFKAIYPGTEWCGAGNIAKNSGEVGLFKNTDSCCREHDMCKNNINAGESKNGLLNNGIFTRSHCLCDSKFYQCLKDVRSIISTNVGITYFNILRPQCYKEAYPAQCVKYGWTRLTNNKCLEYDYDKSKNKTWQWFDSPDFL